MFLMIFISKIRTESAHNNRIILHINFISPVQEPNMKCGFKAGKRDNNRRFNENKNEEQKRAQRVKTGALIKS